MLLPQLQQKLTLTSKWSKATQKSHFATSCSQICDRHSVWKYESLMLRKTKCTNKINRMYTKVYVVGQIQVISGFVIWSRGGILTTTFLLQRKQNFFISWLQKELSYCAFQTKLEVYILVNGNRYFLWFDLNLGSVNKSLNLISFLWKSNMYFLNDCLTVFCLLLS